MISLMEQAIAIDDHFGKIPIVLCLSASGTLDREHGDA